MYPPILRVHKQRSAKDLSNDAYAMFLCFLFLILFAKAYVLIFFLKAYVVGIHLIASTSLCNSNKYPQHMPFYKVDKKYTGCNLKNTELLDCAHRGVCAVIRSNTVNANIHIKH